MHSSCILYVMFHGWFKIYQILVLGPVSSLTSSKRFQNFGPAIFSYINKASISQESNKKNGEVKEENLQMFSA